MMSVRIYVEHTLEQQYGMLFGWTSDKYLGLPDVGTFDTEAYRHISNKGHVLVMIEFSPAPQLPRDIMLLSSRTSTATFGSLPHHSLCGSPAVY